MTTCVYALTAPPPTRLRATGVAGEPLRIVTVAAISAVVGDLRHAPKPTAANVRGYADTLQLLFAQTSALLPARFATCVTGDDELEFILRSRRASLRAALRQVRNRAQMTIRIVEPGDPASARSARSPASPRASTVSPPRRVETSREATGAGAEYLRGRAAEAARARAVPRFDPVRAATARWVRDERIEKRPPVTTVYHLVPRGSVDAYRSALDRAAAAAGLRLGVSGPWPPFAFTGW